MKRTHHFTKFMVKEMKEAIDRINSRRMRKNRMKKVGVARIKVIWSTHQSQSLYRHKIGNKKAIHITKRKKRTRHQTQTP